MIGRGERASDGRRFAGDLEAAVLEVLWSADVPLVPADVLARLGDDLSYSTVLTILGRLHRKGLVDRERTGRAHSYRPAVAELDVVRDQARDMLRGASDRTVALRGFVASLEPGDEAVLRALLDETATLGPTRPATRRSQRS